MKEKILIKGKRGKSFSRNELAKEIKKRRRTEEALRKSERELAIRNRIANIFLTVPDEDMYNEVLKVILEVMESKYGVFGYIDENKALVVPSMTRHIWNECKVHKKNFVFPRDTWGDSSWARAIREKRTIYSNVPSTNTPEGHISILRHISLPIIYRGEAIGLFQVANKPTDYDEKDIKSLETIGSAVAPILSNRRLQRDRQEKERKTAEKELERLNVELTQKNKELEQIVYVTSHDLRSPLVNVHGFSKEVGFSFEKLASTLMSEGVPKDIEEKIAPILKKDIPEALKYILTSISKMDSLLSGLLKLSRLDRTELKKEQLDMDSLISGILKTFEFQVKESGAKVDVSKLPPCPGDEMQINQVFSNLIDNALKYLDPERLGIIKISGYKENSQFVYCVKDNGIGIAPEHQKNIFDGIFHQLEPSVSKGEGLGLTIVRKALERHKGKIWLESKPGNGSKFFVSLPSA